MSWRNQWSNRPAVTKPVSEWPIADRNAWDHAQSPGDPLEPGGFALRWAPTTRREIEKGYGYWLRWLECRGELDPLASPAARVTKERVARYIAHLKTVVSPFTIQARIQQLGDGLRAMAEDRDWKWIPRAAWRIRARAESVRNKRAHLQGPDRLATLGMELMEKADALPASASRDAAVLYRNGLIIALLAYRPMRAANLHMMRIGKHLINGTEAYRVVFAPEETKTRRPLEFSWPPHLVPHLQRYLAVYRSILLAGGKGRRPVTERLWISRIGTPVGYQTIHHHVTRHTEAAFGAHVNPHLFRDCAATVIAIADPEHVQIIAPVLGHSTLSTSERHYNQARGLEAGRRYHSTIGKLRAKAKSNQHMRQQRSATPNSRCTGEDRDKQGQGSNGPT